MPIFTPVIDLLPGSPRRLQTADREIGALVSDEQQVSGDTQHEQLWRGRGRRAGH